MLSQNIFRWRSQGPLRQGFSPSPRMTNEKSNSGRRESCRHRSGNSGRVWMWSRSSGFKIVSSPGPDSSCHSWPTWSSQISGFFLASPWCSSFPYVSDGWVTADCPGVGAGFSSAPLKALSVLHTPTDYPLGWPPTTESAARRCRENTPTSHPPARPRVLLLRFCWPSCPVLYPAPQEGTQQRLGAHAVNTPAFFARCPNSGLLVPLKPETRLSLRGPQSGARAAVPKAWTHSPARQTAYAPLRRKPKEIADSCHTRT